MAENKIYNSAFFKITAKTNLHVGCGTDDYGIIDNLIQRDHITNLPVINSSSLKGALRAFCEHKGGLNIDGVFGAKLRDTNNNNDSSDKKSKRYLHN